MDLLGEALKQPGVKEMMEVYGKWKELDEIAKTKIAVLEDNREITASYTSGPVVRQIQDEC